MFRSNQIIRVHDDRPTDCAGGAAEGTECSHHQGDSPERKSGLPRLAAESRAESRRDDDNEEPRLWETGPCWWGHRGPAPSVNGMKRRWYSWRQ